MASDDTPSALRGREVEEREAEYWDSQAGRLTEEKLKDEYIHPKPSNDRRLELLGALEGKKVLDVGCGTGLWAVELAKRGATVWAIDISPKSVAVTQRRAELNGVQDRVHAAVMSAAELEFPDGFFDLVHGQDIIHHLDPGQFGTEVARVLGPSGKAVFGENCANNRLLMLARDHLCGRFGIPKWSSEDEYPLSRRDIQQFGASFHTTHVEFPEFFCFVYLGFKLGRAGLPVLTRICQALDRFVYRSMPFLRRYSYRQLACFSKS